MDYDLTVSQLERALPKAFKHNATQELVDKINTLTQDDTEREAFRDNLVSYTSVMEKGRFQIGHYISAVKYITHKLLGSSDIEAFSKTFPERYEDYITRQVAPKDIASYVSSYNKNKLVNLIREQTIVPTYVLNADKYQMAINTQAELMLGAKSELVRTQAANSLLTHLKPPEKSEIDINITHKTDNVITELREATMDLVRKQKKLLESKSMTPKELAESNIGVLEGEIVND